MVLSKVFSCRKYKAYPTLMLLFFIAFTTPIQAKNTELDNTSQRPLRVAVATNFSLTLKTLLPTFSQQTGIKVEVISGSTGSLFQQLVHGAPFDIFLAADEIRPSHLVAQGFALKESQKTYTIGEIAFWSADWKNATSKPSFAEIKQLLLNGQQKIAIANPKLAPYGKAAKAALIQQGLWQAVNNRLITGINIGQTFQQVRSRAVSLGIVANSQLSQHNEAGVIIPQHLYPEIKQQLVIIKASKQQTRAQQLSNYLLSDGVQHQLNQQGYRTTTVQLLKVTEQ